MNTTTKTNTHLVGLRGAQRDAFLALTTEQQEVYRHHWTVCGRPAEICRQIAAGEREM